MAEEKQGDTPEVPESPLAKASDRVRASAQYLLGAFAAVGVTLAAGLQLADIGEIGIEDDPLRCAFTAGGLLLALIGIAIAITAASGVSTASHIDLSWLIQNSTSDAAIAIANDPALRLGETLTDVRDTLNNALTQAGRKRAELVKLGDPGDDEGKKATYGALNAKYEQDLATIAQYKQIRRDILDVGSYYKIRAAYNDAKASVTIGALLAAVGIAAFAWGANPPEDTSIDAGSILPKTPAEVTVVLSDEGAEHYREALGEACDTTTVPAIAFAVAGTTYEVTSVVTESCPTSVAMTISEERGEVLPRVAEPEAPAADAGGDDSSDK